MKPLTPEERAIGRTNFQAAVGSDLTRRDFLLGSVAAVGTTGAGLGSFYYGYKKLDGDPLRVGYIGTGDEGNVLINALTPEYIDVVAIADIRPYNIHRAFYGDDSSPSARANRCGLMAKYHWSYEQAKAHVKVYDQDYHDLLNDPNVEGVVIALPLHLHDKVAIEAMRAGKHVLTEKLMAHSVHQCKEMARVSNQLKKHLATGHQRHYSILYDNAVEVVKRGLIGDIHHIRAQWHRGNLPGKDSWQPPMPATLRKDLDKVLKEMADIDESLKSAKGSRAAELTARMEALAKRKALLDVQVLDEKVNAAEHDYREKTLGSGYVVTPLEELIRWRLWNRTGGGLMAELGSHQLDAAGIFCSAMRKDGKKARPISVSAVGVRSIFPEDREVDDHVHCNYEFEGPGYDPNHPENKHKKIIVSYSSINGNGFGGYGEVVLGTKGTIILENEQDYALYPTAGASTSVSVTKAKDGSPTLDTTASGAGPAAAVGGAALAAGPISRGYTEEQEHWAWCVRNFDFENNKPKCHPEVAMADAIIALTTNIAIAKQSRIEFKPEWFDINSDETPEGVKPSIPV